MAGLEFIDEMPDSEAAGESGTDFLPTYTDIHEAELRAYLRAKGVTGTEQNETVLLTKLYLRAMENAPQT